MRATVNTEGRIVGLYKRRGPTLGKYPWWVLVLLLVVLFLAGFVAGAR